ncbi:MAG: hypothetical protein ACLFO2_03205 [Candidatus Woesearchaeota archaeon]
MPKKATASSRKSTAKKATKKATTKKASKAKKATKEDKRKAVKRDAHPDQVFVMVNGHRLKNVKELADVMERIEDHVFNHHVTDDKNDFANWLHDVFEDVELARKIAKAKSKDRVQFVLYKHISHNLW